MLQTKSAEASTEFDALSTRIREVSQSFAKDRRSRQQRRHLEVDDFSKLAEVGLLKIAIPHERGGLWQSVPESCRPICNLLRTLARGDSSVALVSAMHPAVLSYWLTAPAELDADPAWREQCQQIYASVEQGRWWGTITSEPGSGGDIAKTRTKAERIDDGLGYSLTGSKHFGSGSGVTSYMVTTAMPDDGSEADWFFVNVRDAPWDGSQGLKLVAEWDGHGMAATQSHSFDFQRFPATRMAWIGNLASVASRAGGFIGCMFTSVIVGIVDEAMETAAAQLAKSPPTAHTRVEWTSIELEYWLIRQALEAMLRSVETNEDARRDVLMGKTNIADLAERVLTRLCRLLGGSTFSRRSPFGFWFEDVRALGFLRPPWSLAYETLQAGVDVWDAGPEPGCDAP